MLQVNNIVHNQSLDGSTLLYVHNVVPCQLLDGSTVL